ncbi:MAG: LPS assembly protein LptD, partial [Pseudomonadota bacterium]
MARYLLRCAIGVVFASVCRTVVAVEIPSFCRAPDVIDTATVFASDIFDTEQPVDAATIQFEAGSADLTLGGKASLSDGVLIRRGNDFIAADDANYDPGAGELTLDGNVKYSGLASEVSGSRASFDLNAGIAEFNDSDFTLPDDRGHGSAEKLRLDQAGTIELGGVAYTSCAAGNDDWQIKAGDIEIDTVSGIGTARDMRLEFQGIPILYAPYLSFPISDERKSGILIPAFNTSGRKGTEASVPIYWNIAPNYDATITPRVLSRRGLQLNTEARYLSPHTEALVDVRYLPDDNAFGEDRTYSTLQSTSQLGSDWQLNVDIQDVSDIQYFEDLGENQTEASTIFLNRELLLRRPGQYWNTEIAVQAYQVLDPSLANPDQPYRRVPAIRVDGSWPRLWRGFGIDLPNELVRFDRDVGVNGWRWHSEPGVYWDFDNGAFFARPEASLLYTSYRLNDAAAGADTSPDRVLPRFSLDLGTRFEKRWQGKTKWRQTLEPRLLFTHTPFDDQTELPVFDTVDPDFNLVQ